VLVVVIAGSAVALHPRPIASVLRHLGFVHQPTPQRGDILDRNGVVLAASVMVASLYADPRAVRDPEATAEALAAVLPGLDAHELARRLSLPRQFVWIARHLSAVQAQAVTSLRLPGLGFRPEEGRVYPAGPATEQVLGLTDVDAEGVSGIELGQDALLRHRKAIRLTIDVRIQQTLRDELAGVVARTQAAGAAGIVMDAANGQILALVSLPDFAMASRSDTGSELAAFNRASSGIYELGGFANLLRTASPAAQGADGQGALLTGLGLLARPDLGIPEAAAPLAPPDWQRQPADAPTSMRGIAVSPVQLAAALSAAVNGGTYHAPTLLLERGSTLPLGKRAMAADAAATTVITSELAAGVTEATSKVIAGAYDPARVVVSAVAAFPPARPRYLVYAMLDEPHPAAGAGHGTNESRALALEAVRNMGRLLPAPK
jgi:cell division protein FtsI (penicillin-binding protein 3)